MRALVTALSLAAFVGACGNPSTLVGGPQSIADDDDDAGVDPTPTPAPGPEPEITPVAPAGSQVDADCHVLGETGTDSTDLVAVDLPSGAATVVETYAGVSGATQSAGFVLQPDAVIGSVPTADGPRYFRADRGTGAVTFGGNSIDYSVGSDGTNLFAFCDTATSICRYPDFASLMSESSSAAFGGFWASRLTVSDTMVVAAWHAAHELEVMDLASGAMSTLELAGFEDWIYGMSVVGPSLFVLSPTPGDGGWMTFDILEFDLATGDYLAKTPVAGASWVSGLVCHAAAP